MGPSDPLDMKRSEHRARAEGVTSAAVEPTGFVRGIFTGAVDFIGGFRSAVGFLTRVPVGMSSGPKASYAWAPAHFPLVGAALGLLGCTIWHVTERLDTQVRSWLVLAVLICITGAFHEDGLADTADAMGGAFTRERLFEILKDSRIGSFGGVTLVVSLALKASLLSDLMPRMSLALVASQALSRFAPVVLLWLLPYVTAPGVSRSGSFVSVANRHLVVATLFTVAVVAGVHYWSPAPSVAWGIALLAQTISVLWLAWRFKRRAGGVTGDFLGATQQVSELALLLGFAWSLH